MRAFLTLMLAAILSMAAVTAEAEVQVTEGQFAVNLAHQLKLGENLGHGKAIALLTGAGVKPHDGWNPGAKATDELVVKVQAAFSKILSDLARTHGIPTPPTLGFQVLEPPYAGQMIGFVPEFIKEGKITQGRFAGALAMKLRLAQEPSDKDAIALLSKVGIEPNGGWQPKAMATDLFMVRLQVSMVEILKEVAGELRIPLPPTVNIKIVTEE